MSISPMLLLASFEINWNSLCVLKPHWQYKKLIQNTWTHEWLETNGCIISTVATDALVLKHQDISTHSADWEAMKPGHEYNDFW